MEWKGEWQDGDGNRSIIDGKPSLASDRERVSGKGNDWILFTLVFVFFMLISSFTIFFFPCSGCPWRINTESKNEPLIITMVKNLREVVSFFSTSESFFFYPWLLHYWLDWYVNLLTLSLSRNRVPLRNNHFAPSFELTCNACHVWQDRLKLARKRRMQQLKKWNQKEKEYATKRKKSENQTVNGRKSSANPSKTHGVIKKNKKDINYKVHFVPSVMLLEAAARNDIEEGNYSFPFFSLLYLSSIVFIQYHFLPITVPILVVYLYVLQLVCSFFQNPSFHPLWVKFVWQGNETINVVVLFVRNDTQHHWSAMLVTNCMLHLL